MRAAINPATPTAPAPKTAKALPGAGRSALSTAPAPVLIPQGKAAASASGTSGGTFTTFASVASAWLSQHGCCKKPPWTAAAPRGSGAPVAEDGGERDAEEGVARIHGGLAEAGGGHAPHHRVVGRSGELQAFEP